MKLFDKACTLLGLIVMLLLNLISQTERYIIVSSALFVLIQKQSV